MQLISANNIGSRQYMDYFDLQAFLLFPDAMNENYR